MKVALVQCPLWGINQPPPGLAYLSAALRAAGHEVEVFHFELELFHSVDPALRKHFQSDMGYDQVYSLLGIEGFLDRWAERVVESGARMVGVSMFYMTEYVSLQLVSKIKELNPMIAVVLGGPSCDRGVHGPSFIQREDVDAVTVGEGEWTVVEIADALEADGALVRPIPGVLARIDGSVVDGGDRPLIEPVDEIAFPDYADFDLTRYARPNTLALFTSRGCPNRCKFCSERKFWRKYRARSAENVFEEIRGHYENGVRRFYLVDSLINGNMRQLEELMDRIIESNMEIRWYGMAMLRKEMTRELLEKMARAGCLLLQYGIESGSRRVRKDMGKRESVDLVHRILRDTHGAGIRIQGLFIVGYPTERYRHFLATLWFIYRNSRFFDYVVRPTCPYVCLPNSTLFEERDSYGIVLSEPDYSGWTSMDGCNTLERRTRRLDLYKKFVKRLNIPSDIGPEIFGFEVEKSKRGVSLEESDRKVDIVDVQGPGRMDRKGEARFAVRLRNQGGSALYGWGEYDGNPVGLGYHWLDGSGNVLVFDDSSRTYLETEVDPGETADLEILVKAPRKAGEYILEMALVQDGVDWFRTIRPEAARREVSVK